MIGVLHASIGQVRKALPVQVSHRFIASSAVFDDDHLVSCAGLVPVMTLAAQTGLPQLLADKVRIPVPRIRSGSANPSPKLTTVIAGMCAGADSIDDLGVVRSGGMKTLFGGVYAPSTVGTLLREFTFGHARQLESVLREHLVALCEHVELLPGAEQQVFIDIDSLLRPVYGHAKQGASYGHTKIAGKQVLRKGLSPLATTVSTGGCAPVIAGMRLRAGKTGSGKGAGRMIAQAIVTARAAGVRGQILVRGDSAYGNRAVIRSCVRAGAQFSLALTATPPSNAPSPRSTSRRGPRCATPVRCSIPTPVNGSPMPRSPKSATPLSHRQRTGSLPGWWCAASKTHATVTPCSRCGGITRFSPTPTCRWPRLTSSTANTRSSRPCSPT